MPTVSVIIPAYNQGQYVGDAIRSALAQTHQDLEVLVVDDGSTDDTLAVVNTFVDDRVRYFYQRNSGLSAARNTGIGHARGAFLTYLDSDDQFLPDKLEVLLAQFEKSPDLGLVAGQAVVIDERDEPLGEVFERGLPHDSSDLLLGNPLHVGSVLVRREWQERVGGFDETLRSYEDWDMWLRLARAGCPMRSVPRPVSLYRFHREQMTRIGEQMTTATFAVLEKTFRDSALPERWRSRRHEAYSRGFLRAAAQAYSAKDFSRGRLFIHEAVELDPALAADGAEPLARVAAGWANYAKVREPLTFLAGVYEHLPEELSELRRRRRSHMAREALHLAMTAHRRGDVTTARSRLRQAIRYQPRLLLDRSVLSMLVRRAPGARAPQAG